MELTFQLIAGLIVLAVAIMIAVRFKYIEHLSQSDENVDEINVDHQQ
jgi:predicted ferric reductase